MWFTGLSQLSKPHQQGQRVTWNPGCFIESLEFIACFWMQVGGKDIPYLRQVARILIRRKHHHTLWSTIRTNKHQKPSSLERSASCKIPELCVLQLCNISIFLIACKFTFLSNFQILFVFLNLSFIPLLVEGLSPHPFEQSQSLSVGHPWGVHDPNAGPLWEIPL